MNYNGTKTQHRPDAARKLAATITAAKTGHKNPLTGLRAGRIDRTRVARLGARDFRVFHAPHHPSPSKVRAIVLLDASGSMRGLESTIAAQMARDFADAFASLDVIPVGGAEVWAHTATDVIGETNDIIQMYPLWRKGLPTHYVDKYLDIPMSGNEDGWALAMVGDRLAEMMLPGETGVIIVVSDGAPVYDVASLGHTIGALQHVAQVAAGIRQRGVAVVSVSVSAHLRVASQVAMYGRENVIAYDPNISVTAQRIATAIGKQLNDK
jgi:hypothetical protein